MALTQISTAGVKDDAVTAGKIPANAVGSSELADNAVDTAAIAADAITGAKIADDAINSEHYTDGSIDTAHIADSQVTTAKIAADAVTTSKIADNSITTALISDANVTNAKLANNAVTTSRIADNSVTNAKVADDAIGVAELSASGTASSSTFLRGDNSWTAVTSTTINTNGDNRVLTGTGTANTIQGESQLLFDSSGLLYIKAPDGGNRYFFGETGDSASAQLSLYNSSDTQKVRIAAGDGANEGATFFNGGNVGIGTSNPGSKLQITTAAVDTDVFRIMRQDNADISLFRIFQDSSSGGGAGGCHLNTNNRNLMITAKSSSSVTDSSGLYLKTSGELGIGTASPSDNLHVAESGATSSFARFSNSNVSDGWSLGAQSTGRFQITENGVSDRLIINKDGTSGHLGDNYNLGFYNDQGASSSYWFMRGSHSASGSYGGGTDVYFVRTNGNVENANNSYGSSSDIKLKENIVDASSQWNDIKNLKIRKYNFKKETGLETHTQIGLVAQEAELVSAGLVEDVKDTSTNSEGKITEAETVTKHIKYSVLYMKAVKALQEAIAKIETLETKVAALEAK